MNKVRSDMTKWCQGTQTEKYKKNKFMGPLSGPDFWLAALRAGFGPLGPIWLRLSMSMSTTIISSPALLQRRVAKIAQISCSTYIFLIIIEQWQNLESPLYIPLEPPRVEVVDVDLEFPNQVEPRRYPRLRKCVSMERSVPADTRLGIYKQLLVSKYFTWKGSQICGGDHSHTCRG